MLSTHREQTTQTPRWPLKWLWLAGALCLLVLAGGVSVLHALPATDSASARISPPLTIDAGAGQGLLSQGRTAATTDADLLLSLPASIPAAAPDRLRVLALRDRKQPDEPALAAAEVRLLENYAADSGLELNWVLVDSRRQLLPALNAGYGDLIAGQQPAALNAGGDSIEFTQSRVMSRPQVVARRDSPALENLDAMAGQRVAVQRGSVARPLLDRLAERHPDMNLVEHDDESASDMLRRVLRGEYDLAVADSAFLEQFLPRQSQLGVMLDLPGADTLSWAVPAGADELRASLDRFLGREALSRSVSDIRFNDLPSIDEGRLLRVITYQSPANYYLADDGELRGFEYELVREFAERRDLRVEVVVAPSQKHMLRWLLEGRGDLIAASMPIAGVRNDPRLALSRPYNYAAPLIIGRDTGERLIDARELDGRRVVVPAGSPHKRLLTRYQQRGIDVDVIEADAGLTNVDLLQRVSAGIYDLAVIDSHKSAGLLGTVSGLEVQFPVSEPLPHGWVMRADDRQLQAAVNDYIDSIYRSRDYNILHTRYFERPVNYRPLQMQSDSELLALGGELSPYDQLVQHYAEEFGFDWRLIVAQMYQESRFDPNARSSAGALGLMQVLPTTADEIGITAMFDPESAIHAGVMYLSQLYKRFPADIAIEDRIWFSLAAYNAGFHRVEQARRRAVDMDLDPDRWFGNVEKAMYSLSDHTPCRCGQPVVYVREIQARYHNYVRLTEAVQYAAREQDTTIIHDT